jgi:hypothetical protein
MSVVTGLQAIRKRTADSGGNRKSVKYLTVPANKAVKVQFLQELDEGAENYDEDRGVGFLAVEHQHPDEDKWYRRALCTYETHGECVGCEKGLKQKQRLYINVLVVEGAIELDEENGEESLPVVRVLSQGVGPQTVVDDILDYAEEVGSVTQNLFSIKRKGRNWNNTSYTLTALPTTAEEEVPEDQEVYNLADITRNVPYSAQAEFFGYVVSDEVESEDAEEGEDAAW